MKSVMTTALVIVLLLAAPVWGQEQPAPAVSLHVAALQGNLDIVREYIQAGADLNQKDAWGSTPLMIASTFGRTEVAKALIDAGADLDIRGSNGSTPLHIAAFLCYPEIVQALLDKGADRRARNDFSNTPYETVATSFEDVKGVYDSFDKSLAPLGLKLDYAHIQATRPKIAAMLRPGAKELEAVTFAPLPGEEWKVSAPAEQGLDPKLVQELYYDAAGLDNLYGLLVIKNDRLVAEKYFNGGSVEQKALLASVTKSITSALTGLALKQGHLASLDQKMVEFFPESTGKLDDPRKKEITIRQLLEMRGGFPWEETDPALWKELLSGEYLTKVATIPLVNDPGTAFNYSNLTSNWLGIIVARATGTDLKSFAVRNLFTPLGIEPGDWKQDVDGYYIGCADLHLRARDMARFGLMYLHGGKFAGRQILPAQWVKESLTRYSNDAWITRDHLNRAGTFFRDLGYGYQWWSATVGSRRIDFAWGHGGQLIVLLDDLDMIIVVTSKPFYMQHDEESWRHERANFNVVGKFITLLPKE
jgi:CubicO group peptidase (beta-lactamase class C family)